MSSAAALALALAPWLAGAQDPAAGGLEGPLQSDAFVAVEAEAARLLAAGDAELAALRPGVLAGTVAPDEADRQAALAAFARWSEAAQTAGPGAVVPLDLGPWAGAEAFAWPDPEASAGRRHEGLPYALLRRLALLPEPLRALWRAREAAASEPALAAAGQGAEALSAVERRHPGTRAAALAALRRFELEFERGRPALARSWLGRAALHARLAREPGLAAGIAAREAVVWSRTEPPPEPALWQTARALRPVGGPIALPLPAGGGRRSPSDPGLAALADGRIALQLESVVWLVDADGRDRGFEPARLIAAAGLREPRAAAGLDGPWTHAPVADGERLVLVVGRAGAVSDAPEESPTGRWQSNALLSVVPPVGEELPRLAWCLGPDAHLRPDGTRAPLSEVLGAGLWELQPGPARAGSVILVQARRWAVEPQEGELEVATPGEAEVHVLALDAATGSPLWRRELGRGTDLVPDLGLRTGRRYLVRTAAMPLVVSGERVFVGTSLGLGLLLDLADGRLAWSFANRRRAPEADGWRGLSAPPLASSGPGGPASAAALWAPSDSDRLYFLRLAPDLDGAGLLLHPPLPIGEAEELVGGGLERVLALGRAGARRTLFAVEPESGRRLDSVYLGREERFVPGALAGGARALAATSHGLYLFDLERELYLLQQLPLELDAESSPGGLFARGADVWLIADRRLWRFRAE